MPFNPHPTRKEVFQAIDGERAYQNALWRGTAKNAQTTNPSVHAFLVFMDDYLRRAKADITQYADPVGEFEALSAIRKITALGVACMEAHGAPFRDSVTPQYRDFLRHGFEE